MVVAFEVSIGGHLRPQHIFIFIFVVAQFGTPNNGMAFVPHTLLPRLCTLPNIPPTANTKFWLVVVLSNQKMATKGRDPFPLSVFDGLHFGAPNKG
jgi:hypothetical protein